MICFVRGQTLPSFLKFLRRFKVQSQVVILSKSPTKFFLQVLQIFIGVKNYLNLNTYIEVGSRRLIML